MEVTAWSNGSGTYGLRIGFPNRDEFFDSRWEEILLEIDGEVHPIKITAGFWNHCPEVRSPVIRDWLRQNQTLKWPRGEPPRMQMVHLAENRFRLIP